jgi:hypothetical protein
VSERAEVFVVTPENFWAHEARADAVDVDSQRVLNCIDNFTNKVCINCNAVFSISNEAVVFVVVRHDGNVRTSGLCGKCSAGNYMEIVTRQLAMIGLSGLEHAKETL